MTTLSTSINIIGCGESASRWDGSGHAIGVNDAERCGHPVQNLVIVNAPSSFENEPERLKVMINTKALVWTNLIDEWHVVLKTQDIRDFPEARFRPAGTVIKDGEYYFSSTSPMVAMSLGYNLGASELNLYGVDFNTHQAYRPGIKGFDAEVQKYLGFVFALKKKGVRVRVTAESYLSRWIETI